MRPAACINLLLLCAARGTVASFCTESGWDIEWADEFNGAALNSSNWVVANNTEQNDSMCRDATCVYENVAVSGGHLRLTAKRESRGWASYTTGAVFSKNKRFWAAAEGSPFRLCVSGILPGTPRDGAGLWPAFWMMPNDVSCWPSHGELDLMEEINGDGVEHYTYHVSSPGGKQCNGDNLSEGGETSIATMATQPHEYAVEVGLGRFAFVVDGQVKFNSTSNSSIPVHDVPWYAILNFAVGGPWPKPPTNDTKFPVDTLVDYVRVSRPAAAPKRS